MTGAYLDAAAAVPPAPEVRDAMARAVAELWASPSGLHPHAAGPAAALEEARAEVAALIGAADPDEVVFTCGTSEARALAVTGLLSANRHLGRHAVLTALEHPAVATALLRLAADGVTHTTVGVDHEGHADPTALATAAGPGTALVCLHHGHHEVGTLQDLGALIPAARGAAPDARIHVDAAETAGLLPLDVRALGADAVTVGGPAMGAPAWSGALWVRPGAGLHPLVGGGAQEGGKRAGPQDLPGIVGLGAAARLARASMGARAAHRRAMGERLAGLLVAVPGVTLNGPSPHRRVPGNVHVSVHGVEGETLTVALGTRGVAVSPGSACTADAGKASPTLLAMGADARDAHSGVLLGAGDATTAGEVDAAAAVFAEVVAALRAMSPVRP
ncbi:MAG: aminotransferase class V-fold PLP-dependent enzyme [Thermoleophilia bacterium]|nr:aminotransferase class V-fold PLP-dependent enzyme [Thermoleophilia bacterium]